MRVHVFQHVPHEGPAAIGAWASARGHSVATTHLFAGEPLPSLEDFEMLVVMGGPMNIYQYRDHPWLKPERRFLEKAISAGKKLAGACLGSQLLADALGARVTQNAQVEIGWHPIRFSAEARRRFPALPESQLALHWHGDTFELPEGAIRLAESDACAEQGYWYDDRVLGLQFHPEITPEVLKIWCEVDAPQPGGFVQSPAAILNQAEERYAESHRTLFTLLDALDLISQKRFPKSDSL
ncbi:MAG TPA: type 1 glutamine amidotransferase [Chthoniobacterales bacterium]